MYDHSFEWYLIEFLDLKSISKEKLWKKYEFVL